ncbi:hypothetical protein F7Q99_37010 [Streptomyces kaniharaensis]|uniref:Uncharacterized protein n=1 Tax=Streptomyces kaniharaensis TaxID=212423 RepID=A0A6N7L6B3_9ACTN|nr:hypothetical protein [Streptomyces kaniharaensis]MQS17643.1 hypothetical protein [Streptomyces kaniharaensis]
MSDVESELDELLRELDSSPRWASSPRRWVDDPALLQVVLDAARRARKAREQLDALVETCTEPSDLVTWPAMTMGEWRLEGEAAEQRDADRRQSDERIVRQGAARRRAALDLIVQFADDQRAQLAAQEERALGEVAAGPPKERGGGWWPRLG